MRSTKDQQSTEGESSPLAPGTERQRRGWTYFGPEAGIHSWLFADLLVLVIASLLGILYVWADRPQASDAGTHTLSGWLVGIFGARLALPGGLILFSVL